MFKLFIIILAFTFNSLAFADDINKLFNFEIGQNINLSQDNLIKNDSLKSSAIYSINFRDFNEITVDYTPETHRISSLFAKTEPTGVCSEERDIIVGIFSKRFGEFKTTISSSRYLLKTIKSDDKVLSIFCAMDGEKPALVIGLYSSSMEEMAKKEKINVKSKSEHNNF